MRKRINLSDNSIELSDHEAVQCIFDYGLSSFSKKTIFSGLGVGMTALLISIKSLNGKAEVFSQVNKGCKFVFSL